MSVKPAAYSVAGLNDLVRNAKVIEDESGIQTTGAYERNAGPCSVERLFRSLDMSKCTCTQDANRLCRKGRLGRGIEIG